MKPITLYQIQGQPNDNENAFMGYQNKDIKQSEKANSIHMLMKLWFLKKETKEIF